MILIPQIICFIVVVLMTLVFFRERNIHDKKTKETIKIYEETIKIAMTHASNFDNIKWETILLDCCTKDIRLLEEQHGGVIPIKVKVNELLMIAAENFHEAFKFNKTLLPHVARIINLLQLFVMRNENIKQSNFKTLN